MSESALTALPEQRANQRVRSLLGARLQFNNRRSSLDGLIRNLSEGGARLQLANGRMAPDEFEMFVPQRNQTYRARLAWRIDDCIGVQFLEPAETGERTSDNMRALRSENDHLRTLVRNLKLRLQQVTGSGSEG